MKRVNLGDGHEIYEATEEELAQYEEGEPLPDNWGELPEYDWVMETIVRDKCRRTGKKFSKEEFNKALKEARKEKK